MAHKRDIRVQGSRGLKRNFAKFRFWANVIGFAPNRVGVYLGEVETLRPLGVHLDQGCTSGI